MTLVNPCTFQEAKVSVSSRQREASASFQLQEETPKRAPPSFPFSCFPPFLPPLCLLSSPLPLSLLPFLHLQANFPKAWSEPRKAQRGQELTQTPEALFPSPREREGLPVHGCGFTSS